MSTVKHYVADWSEGEADYRERVAEDYPEDSRNLECAKRYHDLAAYLRTVAEDDIRFTFMILAGWVDPDGDWFTLVTEDGSMEFNDAVRRDMFHGRWSDDPVKMLDALSELAEQAWLANAHEAIRHDDFA